MSPTNATAPRLTIGIPVYNGETYLPAAVDSLLAQTYTDFELIISDNCSTDGTEEIGRGYAARDSRVRYERHPRNIGIAGNYSSLVTRARGELFRWAAVDDMCRPEAIERCVTALDANPGAVLAYTVAQFIDEVGAPHKDFVDYEDGLHLVASRPSDRFTECLGHAGMCNPLYGIVRLETLRRTGGLGNYIGSDIVLLAELALYGTFQEIPERLFLRRIHSEALSSKSNEAQQDGFTPGQVRGAFMREWRHLWELWRGVMRAPISTSEQARITAILLRRGRWNRDQLARELWLRASDFIPTPVPLSHGRKSA